MSRRVDGKLPQIKDLEELGHQLAKYYDHISKFLDCRESDASVARRNLGRCGPEGSHPVGTGIVDKKKVRSWRRGRNPTLEGT